MFGPTLEGLPPSEQQDFTLALRNLPLTLRASGRIAFGIFCTSVVNLLRFIVSVKSVATAEAEMNAFLRGHDVPGDEQGRREDGKEMRQ